MLSSSSILSICKFFIDSIIALCGWNFHIFFVLFSTFVCPTEIIAFSDRAKEFRELGVEVLAASTDSKFSHLAWINTPRKHGGLGEMQIPVLADTNHKISRDYGVLKEDEGIAYR